MKLTGTYKAGKAIERYQTSSSLKCSLFEMPIRRKMVVKGNCGSRDKIRKTGKPSYKIAHLQGRKAKPNVKVKPPYEEGLADIHTQKTGSTLKSYQRDTLPSTSSQRSTPLTFWELFGKNTSNLSGETKTSTIQKQFQHKLNSTSFTKTGITSLIASKD